MDQDQNQTPGQTPVVPVVPAVNETPAPVTPTDAPVGTPEPVVPPSSNPTPTPVPTPGQPQSTT